MSRRDFLKRSAALAMVAPSLVQAQARGHIVVVGGGFAGVTAAKHLRAFAPALRVTLVEPSSAFYSCPLSCRVLLGAMGMRELTQSYEGFAARHGVAWIRDRATGLDAAAREVVLASGRRVAYDRLIVAPGVDYDYSALPGLASEEAQNRMPHAWKAGESTIDLRQRIGALRNGDAFAIHVPKVPFRATAAPYERACIVATFMQEQKIKGKVLVFDANADVANGKDLFTKAWKDRYSGIVEYAPNTNVVSASTTDNVVELDRGGKVRAALWNVIPPQRAGAVARDMGLANAGGRWCNVDFRTYESTAVPGVHVIGDSIAGSPGMPKSAHLANQEAKVCAMAISRQMANLLPVEQPVIISAAYSFVSRRDAGHAVRVFRYDNASKQMLPDTKAGGNSAANEVEGIYAMAWLSNILGDTFD